MTEPRVEAGDRALETLEPNHHWKWFRARGQVECPQKDQAWHKAEPQICRPCDYAKKTAEAYAALIQSAMIAHDKERLGTDWQELAEKNQETADKALALVDAMNAQERESGWLIEKGRLCLGSCGSKPSWVTFTDPTAVRFARKVDAENMLASLRAMSDKGAFQNCTINDHRWQDVAERLLAERKEGK